MEGNSGNTEKAKREKGKLQRHYRASMSWTGEVKEGGAWHLDRDGCRAMSKKDSVCERDRLKTKELAVLDLDILVLRSSAVF